MFESHKLQSLDYSWNASCKRAAAEAFFSEFGNSQTSTIIDFLGYLNFALEEKDYERSIYILSRIASTVSTEVAETELSWLLNTPVTLLEDELPKSSLQRLVTKCSDPEVLKQFLSLSTTYEYKIEIDFKYQDRNHKLIQQHSSGNGIVHYAVSQLNLEALKVLSSLDFNFNSENNKQQTPLTLLLYHHGKSEQDSTSVKQTFDFLVKKHNWKLQTKRRDHPLEIALSKKNLKLAEAINRCPITAPLEYQNQSFSVERFGRWTNVNYKELVDEIFNYYSKIKILHKIGKPDQKDLITEVVDSGLNLYRDQGRIYHLYLYFASYLDGTGQTPRSTGQAFTKLSLECMYRYNLERIKPLLAAMEGFQDFLHRGKDSQALRFHHNEAEFLHLLSHPDITSSSIPDKALLTSVVRVLTSAWRYFYRGREKIVMAQGGWLTIKNWARIGQLTNGFLRHRFAAMSIKDGVSGKVIAKSLLEELGFKEVSLAGSDAKCFGKCFVLFLKDKSLSWLRDGEEISDKNAFVAFMQGGYVVSNPQSGKLFIRNSSLKFGRDNLRYPAYHSYTALKPKVKSVLPALTPKRINKEFTPIMDSMINGVDFRASDCREEVADLLAQLDAVINYIDCATFDTDAKRVFSSNQIMGAYNSKYFKYFVRNLGLLYQQAKGLDLPDLAPKIALVLSEVAPFSYIPFQLPQFGAETPKNKLIFELDDFAMQVLEDLANGKYQYDDFFVSGLQFFFQTAINERANLFVKLATE